MTMVAVLPLRSTALTGALLLRNPITGTAGCCACAASDHAAVAPPSSVMNSRLFNRSNRIRSRRGQGLIQDIELAGISQRV
jgi:hypothetical protein